MELERHLQELRTLNTIGEILNQELDFSRLLQPALEKLIALVGLTTGWVFLTRTVQGDTYTGSFRLAAQTGLPPALCHNDMAPLRGSSCECLWLLQRGKLDRGVNIVTCSRLESARGDKGGLEVHASVPLLGRGGPVGVINLTAPGDTRFSEETLALLTAVGRQLGTAFDRAMLLEERTLEARYLAALEERHRLARDMHDSVSQLLFAASLALKIAQEDHQEAQKQKSLTEAGELVDTALAELRRLVEVLRPADLSAGLTAALSRLVKRVRGGTKIHLEAEPIETSEVQAEALYRIAQEALHNVLKHAGAKNAWVRLEGGEGITLTIDDDGQGLPTDYQRGVGIASMTTRTEALGGKLTISNRARRGTRVQVVL